MDSRAETEGLRTENQSLRNVVQQTNQKLNALISIQIENADRGGDAVNEELRMLRSKTATLEAEIQVPSLQVCKQPRVCAARQGAARQGWVRT